MLTIDERGPDSGRSQRPLGRLDARPPQQPPDGEAIPRAGLRRLHLQGGGDPLLFVPRAAFDGPVPLLVMLHGARGEPQHAIDILAPLAEEAGLLVLAPCSRGRTWDGLGGRLGPDVAMIDHALARVFTGFPVAPTRVAIGGFSDGASYALMLGLANGDLLHAVVAFSPGSFAPPVRVGCPRVFVSHGTDDRVLPIDACSRRVVPGLRAAGYPVRYEEFAGGHLVPPGVLRAAIDWLTE